ncbi:MAG: hypothetical protein J0L77_00900 [Alphaproteobacteria bacterium]|nr:hypothetical protein [Alphaproteobacteria bacterium]
MDGYSIENIGQAWGHAQAEQPSRKVIVNYLWINKNRPADEPAPLCSVPLESVHRALENANRYPNASFSLWLDPKTLDDSSRFFVASYIYAHSQHRNVNIQNLRDIPAYAGNPIFRPEKNHDIWARCDLARYLVLQHILNVMKPDYAIYSDLDMKDVCIEEACRIMDVHGLAIAAYRHIEYGLVFKGLENSYLAISRHVTQGIDTLNSLIEYGQRDAREGDNGYNSFIYLVREHFDNSLETQQQAFVSCLTLPMGARLPERPEIQELGLNTPYSV